MKLLLSRIALACALPLLLSGCLLVPGKFTSGMTINADRSFAFSYKGQVIAADPNENSTSSEEQSDADKAAAAKERAAKARERDAKNRDIAAALSKEAGYRLVVYKGDGVFEVDYAITGLLSSGFIWPFNSDAEVMIPFIAAEVRKDGTVRMRAPAFGKSAGGPTAASPIPALSDPSSLAEGVFTLTTNAEIVMQNQEEGPKQVGGAKVISWTVGALKKDAPTAVLRMAK